MNQKVLTIIDHSDRVEQLFARYQSVLGDDFNAYRGHVYRVLTYTMYFLNGAQEHRALVETALVYHDLGLWTAGDLAYLEPSETLALRDNEQYGWGLDPELLRAAIHWHHKVWPYRGKGEAVINAVRKGDWIDASQGLVRKGLSKAQVAQVQASIPDYGFPDVLQRLAKELGGNALNGNLRVLRKVFKW